MKGKEMTHPSEMQTLVLNVTPRQARSIKSYYASLIVNNDLLSKLKAEFYSEIYTHAEKNIEGVPVKRDSLGDAFYGYGLDEYSKEDIQEQWEKSRQSVVESYRNSIENEKVSEIIEKILESISYE